MQACGVIARACATRLREISNYLESFLGPDSNVPLTKEDLINILNCMVPAQWRRSMSRINFQPFTKSMTKIIEIIENLELMQKLPPSNQGTRRVTMISQKIGLKSQNPRLRSFLGNILRTKGKRGRGMALTPRMTTAVSTVQSFRLGKAPSRLTTRKSVGPLLVIPKK